MFAVHLNSATPPYVVGYEVMSPTTFTKQHAGSATVLLMTKKDFSGTTAKSFVQSFWKYYQDPTTKKLALDTNK